MKGIRGDEDDEGGRRGGEEVRRERRDGDIWQAMMVKGLGERIGSPFSFLFFLFLLLSVVSLAF